MWDFLFVVGVGLAGTTAGLLIAEGVLWIFERPVYRLEHRDNGEV